MPNRSCTEALLWKGRMVAAITHAQWLEDQGLHQVRKGGVCDIGQQLLQDGEMAF